MEKHNVQNLYIFSDAPKTERDEEGVLTTRKLIKSIHWTKPEIICQEVNQGLARSIVGAANYIFQSYDRLILLEDDCVPRRYYFDFIRKCLSKYEENEKIFGISGFSVPISDNLLANHPFDIYFYPRIGSWGWATWKRAWKYYDLDLAKLYKQVIANNIDINQGGSDMPGMVQRFIAGQLKDVWTLNWVLTVYLKKGYYIYPIASQIQNIGCDGSGLHSGASHHFDNFCDDKEIKRLPDNVIVNQGLIDNYNNYFGAKKTSNLTHQPPISSIVNDTKNDKETKKSEPFFQTPLILLYNRVANDPINSQLLAVSPQNFESHLKELAANYRVIPLSDLLNEVRINRFVPHTVAITFDDGYADNLTNALPLLEKYNLPATVFVTSGMVGLDREFWWDAMERIFLTNHPLPEILSMNDSIGTFECDLTTPQNRLKVYDELCGIFRNQTVNKINQFIDQLLVWAGLDLVGRDSHRVLNLPQLKKLASSQLIEIGSHTLSHSKLSILSQKEQLYEIQIPKQQLSSVLQKPVSMLSYPYGGTGDFTKETARLVAEVGYSAGIANIQGDITAPVDMYAIPRRLVRNWSGQIFIQWLREKDKRVLEVQTLAARAQKLVEYQCKTYSTNN